MTGQTRQLATWVGTLEAAAIPKDVLERARSCLLDTLACACAGAALPQMQDLRAAMLDLDTDGPGRTWFGPGRCSMWTEAFVNGSFIHALDYDDSHKRSKTHPGAGVVPAAMAAARWIGADMEDLFAGIVAGYEVSMRLGNAVGVEAHRRSGWHATSTCGTIGAAAAASRVLRLNPEQVTSALGNGATQAAGLWAFSTDGAMNKKFHPGHAARAGLGAAVLARAGITGSQVGLEAADGGFFAAFAPDRSEAEWTEVLAAIGAPFWLPEVALKPYPCCRTAHTAIDAIRTLRDQGLRASDVDHIEVRTYRVGVEQCGFRDPVNATQAAFSTPYLVACALVDGWVGVEHFTPRRVDDPTLHDLQRRVRVVHDPALDERFPDLWPSRVLATKKDGAVMECHVDVALGDPAEPMSEAQLAAKVRSCVEPLLGARGAEELIEMVRGLPASGPSDPLWRSLETWAATSTVAARSLRKSAAVGQLR